MKMKKCLVVLFSLALVVTLMTPALATENDPSLYQEELEYYAYMNLKTADETLEAKVLEARSEIIMNTSWVVDGVNGYVVDENDNIVRKIPEFHDIFPSDWDIPAFHIEKANLGPEVSLRAEDGYWSPTDYPLSLENPSDTQNTRSFTHFTTHGFIGTSSEYSIIKVRTRGFCCNRELDKPTYNVGYTNYYTGESLGLSVRMSESESFAIEPPLDIEVAIRASTYSTPADWILTVDCYRIYCGY